LLLRAVSPHSRGEATKKKGIGFFTFDLLLIAVDASEVTLLASSSDSSDSVVISSLLVAVDFSSFFFFLYWGNLRLHPFQLDDQQLAFAALITCV